MELKWLEDFVALAETSSFSRAAEARHITQSAFSRRIKQLEAWLGIALISRATMPAELTPAGRSFLSVAQESVRTLYSARDALRPTSEPGMVRLAALHTLTMTFFPQWIQALGGQTLGLRTSLIPDRGGIEANLAALVDGEADFFLTYAHPEVPFHLDRERFDYLAIGREKVVPVAAPQVRGPGDVMSGAGLLDAALVQPVPVPYLSYGLSSFFGVALCRLFERRPPFSRRTMHENTISAGLKTLALTGIGLCWLPEGLVRDELASGALVPATRDDAWTLDVEIRLYRHLGPSHRSRDTLWTAASSLATN